MKSNSDHLLTSKTTNFVRELKGEDLDSILPEAFAVVREVSERTIVLRPFDVQLVGRVLPTQRVILPK